MSTGLAVALNVLPARIVFFEQVLGAFEIRIELKSFL